MSEPIQFTGIGNLLTCTRCGQHAEGHSDDLKHYTILYNGRVPVAILCEYCELQLTEAAMLDEEKGIVTLYQDDVERKYFDDNEPL